MAIAKIISQKYAGYHDTPLCSLVLLTLNKSVDNPTIGIIKNDKWKDVILYFLRIKIKYKNTNEIKRKKKTKNKQTNKQTHKQTNTKQKQKNVNTFLNDFHIPGVVPPESFYRYNERKG